MSHEGVAGQAVQHLLSGEGPRRARNGVELMPDAEAPTGQRTENRVLRGGDAALQVCQIDGPPVVRLRLSWD